MASVRLLSESGHGLPRVGAVVDPRLGERLVRVRVRVRDRDRDRDRDRGLGFGSGLVSASEMRKRMSRMIAWSVLGLGLVLGLVLGLGLG